MASNSYYQEQNPQYPQGAYQGGPPQYGQPQYGQPQGGYGQQAQPYYPPQQQNMQYAQQDPRHQGGGDKGCLAGICAGLCVCCACDACCDILECCF